MAIYWPTPGSEGRTVKLCVLIRWDFYFCVRSSPLRGFCLEVYQINDVFTALMTWNFWFTSGPDSRCKCTGPRCKLSVSGPSSKGFVQYTIRAPHYATLHYTTMAVLRFEHVCKWKETIHYKTILLPSDKCSRNMSWCRAHSPTHSHQSLQKMLQQ